MTFRLITFLLRNIVSALKLEFVANFKAAMKIML